MTAVLGLCVAMAAGCGADAPTQAGSTDTDADTDDETGLEPSGGSSSASSTSGVSADGSASADDSGEDGAEDDAGETTGPVSESALQLHFLYVHGVLSCDDRKQRGDELLRALEITVNNAIAPRIEQLQRDNPGLEVVTSSGTANIYTAQSSGVTPSDSTDPLRLDDWEAGDPGCETSEQGEPCTTAYEWRYRLAREIDRLLGPDARNIIIVGHSTGARVAFEVASDWGPDGPGTGGFGVRDRIAGVVSVQGMIAALGEARFQPVIPVSFELGCKNSDFVDPLSDVCSQGNGWCEYASRVSGTDAADWVADHKHALALTSAADCGLVAPFLGQTDGSLPLDAQASPRIAGLGLASGPGEVYRPAHGTVYGNFCHTALVQGEAQLEAINAASEQIEQWLFDSAPRTVEYGMLEAVDVPFGGASERLSVGQGCPEPLGDGALDVVGSCRHPDLFDGDDHPIDAGELEIVDGPNCDGTVRWTQLHDQARPRTAQLFFKTYGRSRNSGVVGSLPRD